MNLENPFRKLKVRTLLLRFALISIALGFAQGIATTVTGAKANSTASVLSFYILLFVSLSLWTSTDFKALKINFNDFIGRLPNNYSWLRTIGLVSIIILFSLGTALISLYIISLIAPSFINSLLTQVPKDPGSQESLSTLTIVLSWIATVIVAPITEEFLFRGIILQRWATKWNIQVALLLSSLFFGILHANFVGLSMFGLVMGVLYIKTRTLVVPIICHALNNLLAMGVSLLPNKPVTANSLNSLELLRSHLSFGLVLIAISLPLLINFLWRNWPRRDMVIPYLSNFSSHQ